MDDFILYPGDVILCPAAELLAVIGEYQLFLNQSIGYGRLNEATLWNLLVVAFKAAVLIRKTFNVRLHVSMKLPISELPLDPVHNCRQCFSNILFWECACTYTCN